MGKLPRDWSYSDEATKKLVIEAQAQALALGHAMAICRLGHKLFMSDSWKPIDRKAKVLLLVGTNGYVVRV